MKMRLADRDLRTDDRSHEWSPQWPTPETEWNYNDSIFAMLADLE